ncbi:MAG: beta-ketoacyl-[acyl-carrier-protein] synthase family protein [Verrucomicrobia bacterium]|nr:MAG: beta-ketoacyl-[acyl-carrier-protein] synthase family protein [Verrucomicrobiota bacterium]
MLFAASNGTSPRRRVVVTGAGLVTALGIGWDANAAGFRSGRSAFRPVDLFDVARQRTRMAAEADVPEARPDGRFDARRWRRLDRAARMLAWAAAGACDQARWNPDPADETPVVLGTTSGGMLLGEEYFRAAIATPPRRRGQATRILGYQSQRQALEVSEALGLRGPIQIIANACASGANAIGHAFHWVRSGRADRVLTGGFDGLSQLVFAGFDALQALSTSTCRPFHRNRDGLALGEGAAALCVESLESARRRGAPILGEIVGYGFGTDVHHLTQPHPEGDAALASMTMACADAGIGPGDVGYLNAHGTGTPLNDSAEARAIGRWAGATAVPVSSTKAGIGHTLGTAGAIEAVVCLMVLRGGWLPPQLGDGELDPLCTFPIVREPTDATPRTVLTNSFGFGGANATLAFARSP